MRGAADLLNPPATAPVAAVPAYAERVDPLPAIAESPWRFDFFHALRLLDAYHADKPPLGTARRPQDEPLRLGQAVELSFAPSALAGVQMQGVGGWPRLEVRFMGLFGPNGPLPLHMTSYARERALHKGDETLARFADMFHHRMLLLFYRAWAQAQPVVSLDRAARPGGNGVGGDRMSELIGSLVGVGGTAWRRRDALPDHARLALAGLLARQVRSAEGLERALGALLGRALRVEQFAGRWMALPRAERSRVGGRFASRRHSTARLGQSVVLGAAVFDRQHHIRLHIGPLRLREFEALLPVGAALPPLQALVRQFLGDEFGWDLALALAPAERPQARLGSHARLGWTSWIGRHSPAEACTLHLQPRPPRR
jgi:type VI secretion system protein ImpH